MIEMDNHVETARLAAEVESMVRLRCYIAASEYRCLPHTNDPTANHIGFLVSSSRFGSKYNSSVKCHKRLWTCASSVQVRAVWLVDLLPVS